MSPRVVGAFVAVLASSVACSLAEHPDAGERGDAGAPDAGGSTLRRIWLASNGLGEMVLQVREPRPFWPLLVGVGNPLEAELTLASPVPAGTYVLIADGEVSGRPEVHFDLFARREGVQRTLASFRHAFTEQATQYEESRSSTVAVSAGDELVLRVSIGANSPPGFYIPHGEGASATARLLSIDIP